MEAEGRLPADKEDIPSARWYEDVVGRGVLLNVLATVLINEVEGPHPVELIHLDKVVGLEEAMSVMRKGMELASKYVLEGQAVAIGEIGRPHFPVEDALWRSSNELVTHGMRLAREVDCPVVLHTEEATPAVFRELAAMADSARLPRDRVVKHHSGPLVLPEENHGVFPSVLARKEETLAAARKGLRFLMETDYLDDPRRPGAVLGLSTVPRRSVRLLEHGILTVEELSKIHDDNVREVYGL